MSNVFEGTRFCIHTFGCQMNKHDSERVAGMLEGLGSLPVETIEEADIVVFMTCCVREAADTRLYGQVASMKNIPLRDGTPLDKRYIAVGGCIGQRDGDKLLAALPHLDVVFGTHNLGSLPGLLRRAIEQHGRAAEVIEGGAEFSSALPTVREHDWAAWLPITVGCNNFCSYCIVPYVRGREKSRPLDDIAAEARSYAEAGVKEITLLGQNVNSYGYGIGDRYAFSKLLRACGEIEGLERVRFTSPHPAAFTDDVIAAMAETPNVMHQLHFPLQSGSDRILRAMRRSYRSERFLGILAKIREAMPDAQISTDIIVGFPGETEEDFQQTLRVVEEARFSSAFTFIYSPRPGTPAAAMEQVPYDVALDRLERLLAVQERITEEILEKFVGRDVEVMITGVTGKKDAETHRYTGREKTGVLVHVGVPEGHDAPQIGDFVTATVTHAGRHNLIADPDLAKGQTYAIRRS